MKNLSPAAREAAWMALALLASLLLVLKPVFDYDLYWHLAYGREMLQQGRIIDADVFSYTHAGGHFDNRYWLAQGLMYRLWDAFGGAGMQGLKLAVAALVALLLFRTARNVGASPGIAALTAVLAVLVGVYRFVERPELFSLLFFALLGYLLLSYRAGRLRARWLAAVPVILVAWDWMHGAVYGLGLLGVHVVVENLRARIRPAPDDPPLAPLNLAALASLVAMALNPWGLSTYWVFFEQLVMPRAALDQNMEYRAVDLGEYKPFFAMLAWMGLLTALRWRPKWLAQGLAALALGILGWRISRVTGVFALACAPYLAALLAARLDEPAWKRRLVSASIAAASLFVVGYLAVLKFGAASTQSLGWEVDDQFLPAGTVRFVKEVGLTGNLYNSGEIGGYLALNLYPERKVFHYNHGQIFGDTFYARRAAELAPWNIDYAIVANPAELTTLFPLKDWARIYRDPGAVLVVRREPRNEALIRQYELRLFHPMMPEANYFNLAANPGTRHELVRESAIYLAFRRDPRIAKAVAAVVGRHPELLLSPEITPYLRRAQAFQADVPGFAALAAGGA